MALTKSELLDSSILEIKSEIIQAEQQLNAPSSIKCTHLICPVCQNLIEEEARAKITLQIQLNEKRKILERIK